MLTQFGGGGQWSHDSACVGGLKEQPDKGAHCLALLKALRVFNICIIMKGTRDRGLWLRQIATHSEHHLSQRQNK